MKRTATKNTTREGRPALRLVDLVRRDLRAFVAEVGLASLATMLEEERSAICGPRYAHQPERRAGRAGHAVGELVLGGRRIQVRRPRARTVDGREVELPSWKEFADEDPLDARAVEQMLIGVSTRRYGRSLEPLGAGVEDHGTSKSAVSRRFVAKTEAQMSEWLQRDLSSIDLVALMIDGLFVHEHVMLVALGIDLDGKKHVLGVREGATENAVAVTELLSDLVDRGLPTSQPFLAVIDGGKALRKGLRATFGARAVVQRCQLHKRWNVSEQLPEAMRRAVETAMRQAYGSADAARAKRLLQNLARSLAKDHPSASASLLEGLDETLTVKRFGLPTWLERTLSTTNAIENLNGSVRQLGNRVKRWRDGAMILRWTTAAVMDAETRFHRVRDHKGLKLLATKLRHADAASIEPATEVA